MSQRWDGDLPELDELFPDPEDRRLAAILASVQAPEVTADPAFRSQLRRDLMQQAWARGERRRRRGGGSFWRALFAPTGLAWAGAVAGVLMIAVVGYALTQSTGGDHTVYVSYNVTLYKPVASVQPLEVTFSQPMDHQKTEQAVQITPATAVNYDWSGNTLKITPVSGGFAPNTQYTVSIAPGVASTATGTPVATVKPAVFTVAPTPTATPTATPSPTPSPDVTGERQVAATATRRGAWSPDGTTLFFQNGDKLLSVLAAGGEPKTVLASGVGVFALSPDATQIAYTGPAGVRTVDADGTHPVEVTKVLARTVGWSGGKPVYATDTAVVASTELKLAGPLPAGQLLAWFSPDGAYFLYPVGKTLHALELATGKDTAWATDASFLAWSPDSRRVLYDGGDGQYAAGPTGQSPVKLGAVANVVGATWTQPALVLLDAQRSFWAANADGSGARKLADGDYGSPALAPSGAGIYFTRAGGLWVGRVTALVGQGGPTVDDAGKAVAAFMKARVDGKADQAQSYLDANGKRDYSTAGGPQLLPAGDAKLSRSFTVLSATTGTAVQLTDRLVLANAAGKDVKQLDETLTVVQDSSGKPVIDRAVAGTAFAYGGGPAVLSVSGQGGTYKVSFDSDLAAATAAAGVQLLDATGKPVATTVTTQGRDVVLVTKATGPLRLAVLPALKDKDNRGAAVEYDLDLAVFQTPAPAPARVTTSPLPTPSPSGSG